MKIKTNREGFFNKDNKIGICNGVVNGVVVTDIDEFEMNLEKLFNESESEYSQWGGKRGFMHYLKKVLKSEDKYFKKNPRKITLLNKRYQDFCDDMVLYEMVRHVVDGEGIRVAHLDDLDRISSQVEGGLMKAKTISNAIH